VIVNVCFDLALTHMPPAAISLAASDVVGSNSTTVSAPTRKSATTVEVAEFVKVTVPMLFSLPVMVLLTTSLISRASEKSVRTGKLVVVI